MWKRKIMHHSMLDPPEGVSRWTMQAIADELIVWKMYL